MILPRRAFLRGLATLPLIGGGVQIVGEPHAVAGPITHQDMHEYASWLRWEAARIGQELYGSVRYAAGELRCLETNKLYEMPRPPGYEGRDDSGYVSNAYLWHHNNESPPPSTRAALVLATVGVDWKAPYS